MMKKTNMQGQLNGVAPGRLARALGMVALVLLVALFFSGILFAGNLLAQDEAAEPAAPNAAKVTLAVDTPSSSGWVTSTEVINSDIVTYQIRFENTTGAVVSSLYLTAPLPSSGLDTIECACTVRSHTRKIINALGEEEERTVPFELGFSIGSLANGASVERLFKARVVGQAGGTTIENTVRAFYNSGLSSVSNKVTMNIVADVPNEPVNQANAVSATPNWFSDDVGGTLDIDWADVDQDGDLDLALASTLGTGVYINNGGQLQSIWVDPAARVTYGVRWLDVNNDGKPELVAVGSPNGTEGGRNYVFKFNPGTFQAPDRFTLMDNGEFATANQLTRIETGHFNDDDLPDLLLSVNAISAECPVFILLNQGANLFKGTPQCVSTAATAAIQTGDVNGDGLADLALGIFPNQVRVIVNASGVLSQTNTLNLLVDASNKFLPYDFSWGDIDGDGDLDLAAAFPLQREVRIYRNTSTSATNVSFVFLQKLSTTVFQTPYAVEFADLDRDGALDLVVGDAQPTIYWNTRSATEPYSAALRTVLTLTGERSETWAIRAVDQDGNGSLELSIANRNGPSMLLANYATSLAGDFTPISPDTAGGSIAWGDVNNDGFNDLVVGSPANSGNSRVLFNTNGQISRDNERVYFSEQIGSHAVAVGDMNAPGSGGSLDVAMLMPTGLEVSYNGEAAQTITIPGVTAAQNRSVVAGDMDGDGDLDLAVGLNPGGLYIVENRTGQSPSSPRVFKVAGAPNDIFSLDWGDYNRDHYLDLAIGTGAGIKVFVNKSGGVFTALAANRIVATSGFTCLQGRVQALAWGDVNGDGWPDLAVGTNGRPACLLQNNNGTLTTVQQYSATQRNVTALDWGDWDNDGDLDLAVAHASGRVHVHANTAGRLFLLWQSSQNFSATGIRWGDKDGDSDLDLALSRADGDSGYFENRLVEPGHLLGAVEASLLPNPSAYAYVKRPGVTRNAYQYSTSEILAGPNVTTIPITFRLFKPDGDDSDPSQLYSLLYHYSLNNGGSWHPATSADGKNTTISTTLTREGEEFVFNWNARTDKAISEKALFRVSVINPSSGSAVQNAAGVGISPPFQARATTCIWPANPGILVNNIAPTQGQVFTPDAGKVFVDIPFGARLAQGTGVMTFNWSLNNGMTKQGQRVTFTLGKGDYVMTLTANGRACPETRFASITFNFRVEGETVFLPLAMSNPDAATMQAGTVNLAGIDAQQAEATGVTIFDASGELSAESLLIPLEEPAAPVAIVTDPVLDLDGVADENGLTLSWRLASPGEVEAIRIYQSGLDGSEMQLEAEVPATQTTHQASVACGASYAVVAVSGGEEIPAQQEYRTPVCETGGAE